MAAAIGAVAVSSLVLVASVTDLRNRRIPNFLNGLGLISGLLWLALVDPGELPERLLVSLVVTVPLGVLSLASRNAFGMGDVKLIAVLAIFLGWAVLPVVLIPAMAGAASFGLLLARLRRVPPARVSLPLAPFLALPTLCWSVFALQI